MNQYIGTFYNKNVSDTCPKGEEILVTITPSTGGYTAIKELTFPFDEPVKIIQESDGIYAPLKTQGCTLKIFTDEICWELYSTNSTLWEVEVRNLSNNYILFAGFLTPCIFTLDYVAKGYFEFEAVDYISALENLKYVETGLDDVRRILSVETIITSCFDRLPANIYFNYMTTEVDFKDLLLLEANFFDDDDEPSTCKEVIEEIMKYAGCCMSMYNGEIYIYDINTSILSYTTLNKDLYGAGTPLVELEEVYNKFTIGCDLYEIEDITEDIFDEENQKSLVNMMKLATDGSQLYSIVLSKVIKNDDADYTCLIKPYTFMEDRFITNPLTQKKTHWSSPYRTLHNKVIRDVGILQKSVTDCKSLYSSSGQYIFAPYWLGAYPMRLFAYKQKEGYDSKTSIDWEDYILFPCMYLKDTTYDNQANDALIYKNDDEVAYSIQGGTSYITIKGSVWYQDNWLEFAYKIREGILLKTEFNTTWMLYPNNPGLEATDYHGTPCCLSDLDWEDYAWDERASDALTSTYNKGWTCFKATLKIGNKYWDGTQWTITPSLFELKFHKEDVWGDTHELFNRYDWNKICRNPNVPSYLSGEEGYSIPIGTSDFIRGGLEFKLSTPASKPYPTTGKEPDLYDVPNVYMKDLELVYSYKDGTNPMDDVYEDEDIIYQRIPDGNAEERECDEIDLKINSWYIGKPISKSYILTANGNPVKTLSGKVQEERLLDRLEAHYNPQSGLPKKRFLVNYHIGDLNPCVGFKHETLTDEGVNFILDSYEYDVKSDETLLTLIEL